MGLAIQQIVNALSLGSIYALVALGVAIVFSILRLANFAHGELVTVAGYTLYVLLGAGFSWLIAFPAAILASVARRPAAGAPRLSAPPRGAAPDPADDLVRRVRRAAGAVPPDLRAASERHTASGLRGHVAYDREHANSGSRSRDALHHHRHRRRPDDLPAAHGPRAGAPLRRGRFSDHAPDGRARQCRRGRRVPHLRRACRRGRAVPLRRRAQRGSRAPASSPC